MPYGYFNKSWLLPTLKEHGYALVHWSFGEDWMAWRWKDPKTKTTKIVLSPDVLAAEYIRNAKPGAVFLFHDGGRHRERTLAAVTIVIDDLGKERLSIYSRPRDVSRFRNARTRIRIAGPFNADRPISTLMLSDRKALGNSERSCSWSLHCRLCAAPISWTIFIS